MKLLYPGRDWPESRVQDLADFALELRERVYQEMSHYNPLEFPPRRRGEPGLGWEELFTLLDEAYHPLFRALQQRGAPPPSEGPEDLPGTNGEMSQSLARWGDKRLLPQGVTGQGLSVAPHTLPDEVLRFLGLQ